MKYFIISAVLLTCSPTHGKEDWMDGMLKKENANRAKHGSDPLEYNEELTERAQKWAQHLAEECKPATKDSHMPRDDGNPDALYQGDKMGENIFAMRMGHRHVSGPHFHLGRYLRAADSPGFSKISAQKSADMSADTWYREIKTYPWNTNYDGSPREQAVGHFTQQIWRDSKQVGYGLGVRDGCDRFYVVARYFPTGNYASADAYNENVKPPQ